MAPPTTWQAISPMCTKARSDKLLADWAMRMWAEDMQPTIPDDLKPSTTDGVPAIETHGAVSLQRYWNPKHNPATWQHLVHYTIGYGTDAYSWPSVPNWDLVNDDNYGGDYTKLVQGTVAWVPTVFGNLKPTILQNCGIWPSTAGANFTPPVRGVNTRFRTLSRKSSKTSTCRIQRTPPALLQARVPTFERICRNLLRVIIQKNGLAESRQTKFPPQAP